MPRRGSADGTSRRRPLRKIRIAAAVPRRLGDVGIAPYETARGARMRAGRVVRPLQCKKRRQQPSLFIQLYCRTTAVTLPSRVA